MKLSTLSTGFLLLIAPLAVAAQANSGSYGATGTELVGPNGPAPTTAANQPVFCPVGMRASHLSDGSVIKTAPAHPNGLGQKLHLTLTSPDSRKILGATMNVRGWTAKGRVAQAGKDSGDALLAKTLTVSFRPGTDRRASANVWVPDLTAVVSVELTSVDFDDGTTWTPPQGSTCRVSPELKMLISNL